MIYVLRYYACTLKYLFTPYEFITINQSLMVNTYVLIYLVILSLNSYF